MFNKIFYIYLTIFILLYSYVIIFCTYSFTIYWTSNIVYNHVTNIAYYFYVLIFMFSKLNGANSKDKVDNFKKFREKLEINRNSMD